MTHLAIAAPRTGTELPTGSDPFAHRLLQPALTRAAVAHLGGAVVVHLSPTLQEQAQALAAAGRGPVPRPRTVPDRPPTPEITHERIRRWWRLDRRLDSWARTPADAPRLLLGITGADDHLRVHGAIQLDPGRWAATAASRRPYGLYELPTVGDATGVSDEMLDHLRLRGYRLAQGEFGAPGAAGSRSFAGARAHSIDVVP